jgi:hypothetical protein
MATTTTTSRIEGSEDNKHMEMGVVGFGEEDGGFAFSGIPPSNSEALKQTGSDLPSSTTSTGQTDSSPYSTSATVFHPPNLQPSSDAPQKPHHIITTSQFHPTASASVSTTNNNNDTTIVTTPTFSEVFDISELLISPKPDASSSSSSSSSPPSNNNATFTHYRHDSENNNTNKRNNTSDSMAWTEVSNWIKPAYSSLPTQFQFNPASYSNYWNMWRTRKDSKEDQPPGLNDSRSPASDTEDHLNDADFLSLAESGRGPPLGESSSHHSLSTPIDIPIPAASYQNHDPHHTTNYTAHHTNIAQSPPLQQSSNINTIHYQHNASTYPPIQNPSTDTVVGQNNSSQDHENDQDDDVRSFTQLLGNSSTSRQNRNRITSSEGGEQGFGIGDLRFPSWISRMIETAIKPSSKAPSSGSNSTSRPKRGYFYSVMERDLEQCETPVLFEPSDADEQRLDDGDNEGIEESSRKNSGDENTFHAHKFSERIPGVSTLKAALTIDDSPSEVSIFFCLFLQSY